MYYVTGIDGSKTLFLSGPYNSHAVAISKVSQVVSIVSNPDKNSKWFRAAFMSFGTCRSIVANLETSLGILELPHGCNSYAAIETATGKCVAELFETDRRLPFLNVDKYHLIPMSEHLAGLNK